MSGAETLDEALFPGALAPFRPMIVRGREHSALVLDRSALWDALTRFQRSVEGAWQPACSLWAQHYFNTLLIPATCLLAHDAERVLRIAAIAIAVCPVSGTPLRSVLRTVDADCDQRCNGFLHHVICHLDAVIAEVNALSRLSKRLLRESAERTVAWTLTEISLADPARANAAEARLSKCGLSSLSSVRTNNATPVRQYCCLRDRLPNVPSCGGACPRANKLPPFAMSGSNIRSSAKLMRHRLTTIRD